MRCQCGCPCQQIPPFITNTLKQTLCLRCFLTHLCVVSSLLGPDTKDWSVEEVLHCAPQIENYKETSH